MLDPLEIVEPHVCSECFTVVENQEGDEDCACEKGWGPGVGGRLLLSYWSLRLYDPSLPVHPVLGAKVHMKKIIMLTPADIVRIMKTDNCDDKLAIYSPAWREFLKTGNGQAECYPETCEGFFDSKKVNL